MCLVALSFLRGGLHDWRVPELLRLLRAEPAVAVVAACGHTVERLASLRAVGAQAAADGDAFLVCEVDLVPRGQRFLAANIKSIQNSGKAI